MGHSYTAQTKVYVDTETCGLHGMPVLLQYAFDNGPIHLWDIWKQPVCDTLAIIQDIADCTVVGFNLSFDWFQLCKLYTIWSLLPPTWIPEQHIEEIALLEPKGMDGPCLKPANALDLMLHSRRGPYQSLMARQAVRIRRVPTILAQPLAMELERRIQIDGIYFAKSKDKDAPKWKVYDRKNKNKYDPHFKDVVLTFKAAGGLKYLAEHALKRKPKFHYQDVEPPKEWVPHEYGYAPTALHVSSPEKGWVWEGTVTKKHKPTGRTKKVEVKRFAWPGVIAHFIEHWATNANAREYAADDIVYTRALDEAFGYPQPGDDDSVLACMVAAVRWRGLAIDVEGMKRERAKAQAVVDAAPINVNSADQIRAYLGDVMSPTEFMAIAETTKKAKLEEIGRYVCALDELACERCCDLIEPKPTAECKRCGGTGKLSNTSERLPDGCALYVKKELDDLGNHPAAVRAMTVLSIRKAKKEIEQYNKLIFAGRFHPDFNVIGTLSARMSGGGGLNAQGIKSDSRVRQLFPLAGPGYVLSGGDFDSFEVVIADAVFGDVKLHETLRTGRKIHADFGTIFYPHLTYEQLCSAEYEGLYKKAKSGLFAFLYGGDFNTIKERLGIDIEMAKKGFALFLEMYPGIKRNREKISDLFGALRQPDEGGPVFWEEPSEFVETLLGFRRWFTLENRIAKELFTLAQAPPPLWRQCEERCLRRPGRVQKVGGAVASALYGCAFAITGANERAAGNHLIQSVGAQITKYVQRLVWDLQPAGIHEWVVAPMNVHDEVLAVHKTETAEQIVSQVHKGVESFRERISLIGMTWIKNLHSWAGKKGGKKDETAKRDTVKMCHPDMMNL